MYKILPKLLPGLKLFSIDSQLWKETPLPNQLTLTPLMKTRLSFLVPRTWISTHMMIFEKLFLPWTRISSEILFPKQTVAAICLSAPVTWKGTTNPRSLIRSQSPIQLSAWIHNWRISNTAYPGSLVPSISCCTSPSQQVPQATKTLSISSVRYMNYSPIPLRMSPRSEWIICSSLQASAARLPVWHLPKQLLLWNPKSCWNTPTWLNLPCKSVVPITVEERRIPRVVPLPTIIEWILPQTKTTPVLLPITLFARIFAARHIRRTTILRELPSRRPSTTFPKSLGTHLQRTLGSKRNLFWLPHSFHVPTANAIPSSRPIFYSSQPQSNFYNRKRDPSYAKQEGNRRGPSQLLWLSFPVIYRSEENRRHPSRSQSATAEPVYPPASLQNGNPETGVHHDQSRRLLNQHRPDRRLYARPRAPVFQAFPSIHLERSTVPVPRPPVRNVSVPHGFHQDPQTSTTLGSSQRDSSYRLPRRLAYRGQGPSYFAPSHSARSSQANRSRIFSQTQQVFPDPIPVHPTPRFYDPHNRSNTVSSQDQGSGSPSGSLSPVVFPNVLSPFPRFFHRQGPVHDNGDFSSPSEDSSSLSRQEPGPETVEIMDFSALSISNSQGGTNMVERTITRLERSDFPSLPSRRGGIHRRLRLRLGHSRRPPLLEWPVDIGRTTTSHQPKRALDNMESPPIASMDRLDDSDTLRQHHSDRVCQQVRRHSLTPPSRNCSEDMELLFADEDPNPPELHSVPLQSSRCSIQEEDDATGVENCADLLQAAEQEMGSSLDRHVRQSIEPPSPQICVMGTGSGSVCNGCNVVQLEQSGSSLHLPTMEPSAPGDLQASTRTSSGNTDNPLVADSDLVPDAPPDSVPTTASNSSQDGPPSSRLPRKRPARESSLVADRLEHKIRRLEESGADTSVTDLVMRANPKRYLRYAQVQAKFLGWCRDHEADPSEAASVLNFLAHGREHFNWSIQTLLNYRSSIADMFDDRSTILEFWPLRTFFQAVQDTTIRSHNSTPVDIAPIIRHLHQLGPNHSMSLPDLTAKLCWLLGVCGFMRPSDIERVDLDKSSLHLQDKVVLTVVAPKEKRLGQRIHKDVTIRQHSDPLLCPVATLRSYLDRHAHRPCQFPHPVLPHVHINYLVRDIRDYHRPVYAQRISNHIKTIMSLLPNHPPRGRLRARALGSTRALLAGASTDAVVNHGHWSSQSIFDNFYRLSTESTTNFTALVLGSSGSSMATLEQQSQDPRNEV
jgi:hypothetical protein